MSSTTKTMAQLVATIRETEDQLYDGLNAHGFDFRAVGKINSDAKRELAVRFGKAVGCDGLYDLPPEACK
jgi:hypothetical protein